MKPTPQQELYGLLIELFVDSPNELRGWLRRGLDRDFLSALPPRPESASELFDAVLRCASERGLEETLLETLVASRPAKRARIAQVAARFGISFPRQWDPRESRNVGRPTIDPEAEERAVGSVLADCGPFIGRRNLMARIESHFTSARSRPLVLAGHPGVGKSALARQFALKHWGRYSSVLEVPFTPGGGPPIALASFGLIELKLPMADLPREEQCKATLRVLAAGRGLLLYDNVADPAQLRQWLPPAGSRCHVLVTSNWEDWPAECPSLLVPPLSDADALALVAELVAERFPEYRDIVRNQFTAQLVGHARGLPAQLRPATLGLCTQLRKQRVRGTLTADELDAVHLSEQAEASFEQPWTQLRDDSRRLLGVASRFNPGSIPRDVVREVLSTSGMDDQSFRDALDGCFDLHLLEGKAPLRMHGLLVDFVHRHGQLDAALQAELERRFVAAADDFAAAPGDLQRAKRLLEFPLERTRWPAPLPARRGVSGPLLVSRAVGELGDHATAYAWATVAVAEAEAEADHFTLGEALHQLGLAAREQFRISEAIQHLRRSWETWKRADRNTAVDAANIGRTAFVLGECLAQICRFEEAVAVLTVARDARLKQAAFGSIDHEALGNIAHTLGRCLLRSGDQRSAITELRRALAAKREGGISGAVHGRLNHASIATTLHLLGVCHWQLFEDDEAIRYIESAIEELIRGDKYGRVDHCQRGHMLNSLASCYSRIGRKDDALATAMRAEQAIRRGDIHGRLDHSDLGDSLKRQAQCYFADRRYHEALTLVQCALREHDRGNVHGAINYYQIALCLDIASDCHNALGHPTRAMRLGEQAVAAMRRRDPHDLADSDEISRCFHNLGYHYYRKRDAHGPAAALDLFRSAAQYAEMGSFSKQVDHRLLGSCLANLGICLRDIGRPIEAAEALKRGIEEARRGDRSGQVDTQSISKWLAALNGLQQRQTADRDAPGTSRNEATQDAHASACDS